MIEPRIAFAVTISLLPGLRRTIWLLVVAVPEVYGGDGLGLPEVRLMLHEAGRRAAALPIPARTSGGWRLPTVNMATNRNAWFYGKPITLADHRASRMIVAPVPARLLPGRRLWQQSGLAPADVDTAVLYDHFTPYGLMQLEGFGFCGRGEAKEFITDGAIELGGGLP